MFNDDTIGIWLLQYFPIVGRGVSQFRILHPLEMKLRRAAKARVDRMCKDHPSRPHLNCPEWLKREWKGGGSMTKDEIGDVLRQANFQKDRSSKK